MEAAGLRVLQRGPADHWRSGAFGGGEEGDNPQVIGQERGQGAREADHEGEAGLGWHRAFAGGHSPLQAELCVGCKAAIAADTGSGLEDGAEGEVAGVCDCRLRGQGVLQQP